MEDHVRLQPSFSVPLMPLHVLLKCIDMSLKIKQFLTMKPLRLVTQEWVIAHRVDKEKAVMVKIQLLHVQMDYTPRSA